MNKTHNPYAKALDGLEIPDPVTSFFDFCIEREKIRKKSGCTFPKMDIFRMSNFKISETLFYFRKHDFSF